MFSKEQIIEEMRRIAAGLGGTLNEKEFEHRSTIPLTTLRFHLGSWQRAMKEAGLKPGEKVPGTKPISDDELLEELIRLNKDSGELPTPALIEAKGKYKPHHYIKRWKSIAEAFQQAKEKFRDQYKTPSQINHLSDLKERREAERLEQLEKLDQLEQAAQVEEVVPLEKAAQEEDVIQLEQASQLEDGMQLEQAAQVEEVVQLERAAQIEDIMQLEQAAQVEKVVPVEQREQRELMGKELGVTMQEEDYSDVLVLEGEQEMNHNHQGVKGEKIKFIPQTIKPEKAKIKPRVSVESIDFRGLRFAPASRQGVVYLFGMISQELGFLIESFVSEFPDCEGKRCVDREENQWEPIRIQFEFKSSDFKTRVSAKGYNENQCDLIVCWNHNWEDSPIEVLELRSVLQYLE